MTYRTHYGNRFGIIVDDETMTWTSDPPGHDIEQPMKAYFSRGGPVGSGKTFEALPGGRVRGQGASFPTHRLGVRPPA